jgi:multiple sugar transport system permease protein
MRRRRVVHRGKALKWILAGSGHWFLNLLTYAIVLALLLPSIWIPLTSIRPEMEIAAVPPVWIPREVHLRNYGVVFGVGEVAERTSTLRYFMNSLIVTGLTIPVAMFVGCLAGYAFARFNFRGKQPLFLLTLGVRALPGIAMGIPMFIVYRKLNLIDTRAGLIIIYSALTIPFATWLMQGFFIDLPAELDDAARIDGCSRLGSFLHVALPLVRPGLAATAIFIFIMIWNEFSLGLMLATSSRARTLPVALYEFVGEFRVAWGPLTAVGTVLLIPTVIFTFFAQRHLVKGLTLGAVKG